MFGFLFAIAFAISFFLTARQIGKNIWVMITWFTLGFVCYEGSVIILTNSLSTQSVRESAFLWIGIYVFPALFTLFVREKFLKIKPVNWKQSLDTSRIETQLASPEKRFYNCVIDGAFLSIIQICLYNLVLSHKTIQYLAKNYWAVILLSAVLVLLYFVISEYFYQRTLSKLITGTKVVMIDGTKPDLLMILKRSLSRWVPFEPFSENHCTWWHDRCSKTCVINYRKQAIQDDY